MSDTTTTTPATQEQTADFTTLAAEHVAWWPTLTPEQQAAVLGGFKAAGVFPDEYADYAASFATYAEFVADMAVESEPMEPAAATAEQVQAAAEQAEQAEAEARDAADKTLKAVVKYYRQGETAYRQGLLEAGLLAQEYVLMRLALHDDREAAVQCLEGELAKWSSGKVDANRLIRSYQSYAMLAVPLLEAAKAEAKGGDKAAVKHAKAARAAVDAVPYGFYRDAYCQLLVRQDGNKPTEHWALLPGLEPECLDLYDHATTNRLAKAAVEGKVRDLQARYAGLQAAAEKAKAAEAAKARDEAQERAAAEKAKAREQWAAAEAQRKAAADAAKAEADATKAAAAAKDAQERALAEQAAKNAAAAKAEAERLAANADAAKKAAQEAAAKAEAEAQAKAKEQQAATAKAEAASKAEQKATAQAEQARMSPAERKEAKSAERAAKTVEAKPVLEGTSGKQLHRETATAQNLLRGAAGKAKQATAKDWAEMAAAFVLEHPEPEDVLEHLLLALKGEMSKQGTAACDAALIVLRRTGRTAPTAIAAANAATAEPTNGQPTNGAKAAASAN